MDYTETNGRYVWQLNEKDMQFIHEFVMEMIRVKNPQKRDKKPMTRKFYQDSMKGYIAQVAMTAHYGGGTDWTITENKGDGGRDVECSRLGEPFWIGVKGIENRGHRLLVKDKEKHLPWPDLYVLVFADVEKGTAELLGTITPDLVFDRPLGKVRSDGWNNYIVNQGELDPPTPPVNMAHKARQAIVVSV